MPLVFQHHPLSQSPNELQELLDVTRALLDEMEARQKLEAAAGGSSSSGALLGRSASGGSNGGGGGGGGGEGPAAAPSAEASSAADSDELREKFRIIKVLHGTASGGVVLHWGV